MLATSVLWQNTTPARRIFFCSASLKDSFTKRSTALSFEKQFELLSSHLERSLLIARLLAVASCLSLILPPGGSRRAVRGTAGETHTLSHPSLRVRVRRTRGHKKPVGAHDPQISGGRRSAGFSPTFQGKFHVPGVGSRSRDQRKGVRVKEGKGKIQGHETFRRPAGSCTASPAGLQKVGSHLNAGVGMMWRVEMLDHFGALQQVSSALC